MRRTTTIATLAAICATLAIAPPTAMAKTVKFEGPVDLPYVPDPRFSSSPPMMTLKVTFAGKNPKVVPSGTVKADGLYGVCVLGAYGCNGAPTDGGLNPPAQCHWFGDPIVAEGGDLKIKHKRFSGNVSPDLDSPGGYDPNLYALVTGTVGKRSVTGTVHAHAYQAATSSHPAATCDTGVLTWTASR